MPTISLPMHYIPAGGYGGHHWTSHQDMTWVGPPKDPNSRTQGVTQTNSSGGPNILEEQKASPGQNRVEPPKEKNGADFL